jgi:hypothetical protein
MNTLFKRIATVFAVAILSYSCTKDIGIESEGMVKKHNELKSSTGEFKVVRQFVQPRPSPDRNAVAKILGLQAAASFTPISDVSGNYLTSTNLIDISTLTGYYYPYSSVTDGNITVSFRHNLQNAQAGPSWWGLWGTYPEVEGNNPYVLASNYQNSVTLTLSKPVNTFGFEMQPNYYGSFNYRVEFYNGAILVGSVTRTTRAGIDGGPSFAKLFAATTDGSFDKVIIEIVSGDSGGFAIAQLRYGIEGTSKAIPVDIQPLSCSNSLNFKAKGVLPVAILGTADFNVNDVDLSTIKLNGVPALAAQTKISEVAAPFAKSSDCDCAVTGPDSYADVNLKFDVQALAQSLAGSMDGDQVTLTLTMKTKDGKDLEGKDCVIIKRK